MAERIFPALLLLLAVGAVLIGIEHARGRKTASQRRADWIKYVVFGTVLAASLGCARLGPPAAGVLLGLIALCGAFEFARSFGRRWAVLPAFALFAGCLGHLLAPGPLPFFVSYSLVVLVVACTDAFAQLTGRLWGRTPLCPRLSPNKTREGLLGGLAGAVVAAWLVAGFGGGNAAAWVLAALGIAGAAVAGDLAFSAVKRARGIKDFSRALPGQGGVLDRYDSLILAAPAGYWVQRLVLG